MDSHSNASSINAEISSSLIPLFAALILSAICSRIELLFISSLSAVVPLDFFYFHSSVPLSSFKLFSPQQCSHQGSRACLILPH